MKFVVSALVLLSLSAFADTKMGTPVSKEVTAAKKEAKTINKAAVTPKKEEDCDEKAKKKVEIKEETISLTGNTGCTLE